MKTMAYCFHTFPREAMVRSFPIPSPRSLSTRVVIGNCSVRSNLESSHLISDVHLSGAPSERALLAAIIIVHQQVCCAQLIELVAVGMFLPQHSPSITCSSNSQRSFDRETDRSWNVLELRHAEFLLDDLPTRDGTNPGPYPTRIRGRPSQPSGIIPLCWYQPAVMGSPIAQDGADKLHRYFGDRVSREIYIDMFS